MNKEEETISIGILIPCFNENFTIINLLDTIRKTLSKTNLSYRIIIVDDGSTDNTLQLLMNYKADKNLRYLDILSLPFNHGHQKAIYQGILYVLEIDINKLIIMDGDGEDNPKVINEIIKYTNYDIIFIKRGRRRNSICYLILYYLYRILFFIITNQKLKFGNFCMINGKIINIIASTGFIHLGATLLKLKCNKKYITYNKSKRLGGKSKMSFSKLVIHAIYSFAEFAEEMIYTILKLMVIFSILFLISIVYIFYLKIFTNKAIAGWASILSASFLTSTILCIGFFIIGTVLLNLLISNKPKIKNYNIL